MTSDNSGWTVVVLRREIDITRKELRWWFERHIRHQFTLNTTWGAPVPDEAEFWHLAGWYRRQEILGRVIDSLDPRKNYGRDGYAAFTFENKAEAMLLKLTFGGA